MTDATLINIGAVTAATIGLASLGVCLRLGLRKLTAIPLVVTTIATLVSSVLFWYTHRPLPANLSGEIFAGISYTREVIDGPIIVYTVRVDLMTPNLRFLSTPPEQNGTFMLRARTTSQFLKEFGLQLAINADFFDPWKDYGFLNYYPHVGEGINVRGLAVSAGNRFTEGYAPPANYNSLFITEDNQVSFTPPKEPIYNAISGNMMLLENGTFTPIDTANDYLTGKHPRTAVALDSSNHQLIIILVDGRQPNYSEGVTIPELQTIVLDRGGYNALNLDGGGSVTLAIEGEDGLPTVLNSPIHNHIPGRERPIGNHLGIYAPAVGG